MSTHPSRRFALVAAVSCGLLLAGCPQRTPTDSDPTPDPDGPSGSAIQAASASRLEPGDRVESDSVTLRWSSVPDAQAYALYFGQTANPPLWLNLADTQYSVRGLAACATYYWCVDARLGDGRTIRGTLWSFSTACPTERPDEPAYPAPSNRAFGVPAQTSLTWAPAAKAGRYEVYFGETSDPPLLRVTTSNAVYDLPALQENARYYWRVVARNEAGSNASKTWSFRVTTNAAGPATPSGIFPTDGAVDMPRRIRLEWTPCASAESYDVFLGRQSPPPLVASTSETSFTPPEPLEFAAVYYWSIRAVGPGGATDSPVWSFNTTGEDDAPLAPSRPSPLDSATVDSLQPMLSWLDTPDADAYELHLGDVVHGMSVVADGPASSYRPVTPLEPQRIYLWRVVARNAAGQTAGPLWRFVTPAADNGPDPGGAPVSGGPCTGTVQRVSRAAGGAQSVGPASHPSLSADGRFVAFESDAADVVAGDTNGTRDIFVHDRQSGDNWRVSLDSSGAQAAADCSWPAISADGRYVAFQTLAALVPDDTNGALDVYVHDRQSHTTLWVSQRTRRKPAGEPSISADGRYVAFSSGSNVLVPGDTNAATDVFVRDMSTGSIERVSLGPSGQQANDHSEWPSISADGNTVAFVTHASNFGSAAASPKTFLRDRSAAASLEISGPSGGIMPALSADGQWVAWVGNVAPNSAAAAVLLTRAADGVTTLASHGLYGEPGDEASWLPSISSDGRYVVFASLAGNLAGLAGWCNIYRFDRETDDVSPLSLDAQGHGANGHAFWSAVAGDGGVIAFDSAASNLVSGDTNAASDVFAIECP